MNDLFRSALSFGANLIGTQDGLGPDGLPNGSDTLEKSDPLVGQTFSLKGHSFYVDKMIAEGKQSLTPDTSEGWTLALSHICFSDNQDSRLVLNL